MKKLTLCFVAAGFLALTFVSCKKEDVKEVVTNEISEISQETLSKIKKLGFGTQGVKKVDDGYLVEGDILLSESELNDTPDTPELIIAQEEHYRTFKLVSVSKHPTIKIALNSSSSKHSAAFSYALNEAIRRYNAQYLRIKFQRVTTGADITIVAYYEASNTLGSAGFPNSYGDPYYQIRMNTYHYSTGTDTKNINYIGTIMAHEIGHCIGFRHTDYMNRSYSCGSGGNEGQSTTGVGAVHIPGTPTGPSYASWMLACIGAGGNRPFTSSDKTALAYVY